MDRNKQVDIIRNDLKQRLDDNEKDFYIESIADCGIDDTSNIDTQDIDKLLQFFASTEASIEYQANVFAAMEQYLPDYLVSYLANSDRDNDGLTFAEELKIGTNPSIADNPSHQHSFMRTKNIENTYDDGIEL